MSSLLKTHYLRECLAKYQSDPEWMEHAFQFLTPRERYVLRLFLGSNGNPPLSLQSIGNDMMISRERVRQIICKAERRLRYRFSAAHRERAYSPYPPREKKPWTREDYMEWRRRIGV